MAVYVIASAEITDPAAMSDYLAESLKAGPGLVSAYGGTYLARSGAVEALEGDWTPTRMTIVRFDDMAKARTWFESAEHAALRAARRKAANKKMLIVQGAPGSP